MFFEEVIERAANGCVTRSNVRPATQAEIDVAILGFQQGNCPHNIIVDERGFMYDYRTCATCGCGLGVV